jgi:hypothetical protein
MSSSVHRIASLISFGVLLPVIFAQPATYHFHQEASSTTGLFQLKTTGPGNSASTVQSSQLRNSSPGEYVVKQFDTQTGVPGSTGVIVSGSTLTATIWMRKTSTAGSMFPRVKVHINSAAGTQLCVATGTTALSKRGNATLAPMHYLRCDHDDHERPVLLVDGGQSHSGPRKPVHIRRIKHRGNTQWKL